MPMRSEGRRTASPGQGYANDILGNRTMTGSHPYEWDAMNRMTRYTRIETAQPDTRYEYRADGMRARYYEPWTGRFISEDPAMDGTNWFVYCGSNPVGGIDKNGLYYDQEIDGYRFLFHDEGGGHLHIYKGTTELFSRRLSGAAWHGEGGNLPQKVIEALVEAARAGNHSAKHVIRRIVAGEFGLADDVLDILKGAAGLGILIYAISSLDAYAQYDPADFAEIIATIGGLR